MPWTYSGDPSASNLDATRFEIGDTDITDQLLQDAEVLYTFSKESNIYGAGARCCEAIARKFARQADVRMGMHQVHAHQRSQAFTKLAQELRAKAVGYGAPIAGGIQQVDEPNTADTNSTIKPSIFSKNMMNDPVNLPETIE